MVRGPFRTARQFLQVKPVRGGLIGVYRPWRPSLFANSLWLKMYPRPETGVTTASDRHEIRPHWERGRLARLVWPRCTHRYFMGGGGASGAMEDCGVMAQTGATAVED